MKKKILTLINFTKEKLIDFSLYSNNQFIKFLNHLIEKLQYIKFRVINKNYENPNLSSLSPKNLGSERNIYSDTLLWALKNRAQQNIRNIAITGLYGSGKSTILKTLQENYKRKDLRFLNISLATFKDEKPKKDENGNEIKVNKEELLRLIEISILHQIFFHENINKLPDSRFKKIRSFTWWRLTLNSFFILAFIVSFLHNFYPNPLNVLFKDFWENAIANSNKEFFSDILNYSGKSILLLGVFFIIYKSIRIVNTITINKLKIQDAEIGLGEHLNKSILNHHLDEILYFFSVRPYNVVIFEDLDRFQETEIFTKLRELNLLLNNSKKTQKKQITFIYAVRDDMFSENERTKFFDFIVPIIPFINSSNSCDILLDKNTANNYGLSKSFIEDISYYIDDSRLLHNISNEFYLYRKKLDPSLSPDKLFAIITYKNIYPDDFSLLNNNEGELYLAINSKSIYSNEQIKIIDIMISEANEGLKTLESVGIRNIKELRRLYVLATIDLTPNFHSFVINNNSISIEQLIEDENFEYLKTDELYANIHIPSYASTPMFQNKKIKAKFNEIEQIVDKNKSYQIREVEVKDLLSGKIISFKSKLKELESNKLEARNLKIRELFISYNVDLNNFFDAEIFKKTNKTFIVSLLRNGYITEDYINYISLFHEGSLTQSDYKFLISIKNEEGLEFDFQLKNIEKLISKINPFTFTRHYIFNFSLFDFILSKKSEYNVNLESIISKLKDESTESINFIKTYIDRSEQLKLLIQELSKEWPNIWNYFNNDSSYEEKEKLFKYILLYSDIKSLKLISKQSNLEEKIYADKDFLKIINNQNKIKKIIEALNIMFEDIDFENSPEELIKFIYENLYYAINPKMTKGLIKKFGEFNQVAYDNSNYEFIKNSKCSDLIIYFNDYIDEYVENIYLKIESNVNENESHLIELLNHKNLSLLNKDSIIKKVETKISNLKLIKELSLINTLLNANKIEPTWENILFCHKNSENKITDEIIMYLNNIENSEILSSIDMPTLVEESKSVYQNFAKELAQTNSFENKTFDFLTQAIPWAYSDLDFNNLSEEKAIILIKNEIIQCAKLSFDNLKEQFDGLNIKLLEKNPDKFLIMNDIEFDSTDIEYILISNVLTNKKKKDFLMSVVDEAIITTAKNLELIAKIMVMDLKFQLNDSITNKILIEKYVPINLRLKIFNRHLTKLDDLSITNIITRFEGDYTNILNKRKRIKIPKTLDNRNLLLFLNDNGFITSYKDEGSSYRVYHSI